MITDHYAAFQAEQRGASNALPDGVWDIVAGVEWIFGRAAPGERGGLDVLKPGLVREEASKWLTRWELADVVEEIRLVLSELVTNALRYGVGALSVRMCLISNTDAAWLHLEVWDGSTRMPRIRDAGPGAECGRGLWLVRAVIKELHGAYGVSDGGRRTWCRTPVQITA
ncbi:ATP-binding protein [Streptomyces sp. NPDC050428]|uniref:ATP-binding protein n=1 Tax=Streptomyces sp. NPDC050428 TaxID=3155757 RepID=UPI003437780E